MTDVITQIQEVTFDLIDLIESETVIDTQLIVDEDAGQLSGWEGKTVHDFLEEQIEELQEIEVRVKRLFRRMEKNND